MYCVKCGTENDDHASYCKRCGSKLDKSWQKPSGKAPKEKPPVKGPERKNTIVIVSVIIMILLVLIAVFLCFSIAGRKKEEKKIQEYEKCVARAEKYLEELDYENAEAMYLAAIDIEPKKKDAYLNLADIYIVQEKYEKAIEILEKAEKNVVEEQDEADDKDTSISDKKEELENRGEYTWVVEPTIEADDIFYLASYPEGKYSINELSKQANNSRAVIQIDNQFGIIDLTGKLLTDIAYKEIANFGNSFMMIRTIPEYSKEYDMEWDIFWLDEDGEIEASVGNGALNLTLYYYYEGNRQQAGGISGEPVQQVIPVQEASEYAGLYVTRAFWNNLNSKYALECDGNLITDFIYDECGSLSDGLCAVCQNGKWGYVDEKGQIVLPIEYDASWKQYPVFDMGSSRSTSNVKDYCYAASDGYVPLVKNGKWELRDTNGKLVILPGVFEAIRPVYEGRCWVKKNGKWGVIELTSEKVENVNTKIPENAVEYNGHYYYVYDLDSVNTWDEARQYCHNIGGYLATITSEGEDKFLYSRLRDTFFYESAYFGLTDKDQEGTWVWDNGESVSYTNWHDGEPNGENQNEDYGMYYMKYTDGSWNDGDFGGYTLNGGKAFICEWGDIEKASDAELDSSQSSDSLMTLSGVWKINDEKTMDANGMSMFDLFGSAYSDYGSEMKIENDGSFSYYIGAGIGGTGTCWMNQKQLAYKIQRYDDIQESGYMDIMKNSSDSCYIILERNGNKIYWEKQR